MAKRYSLNQLRELASNGDVSFDVKRLYREQVVEQDPEVIDILKTGHASEAASWLASTALEKMEYGNATRDERLAAAMSHAALAGILIETIAEERGLSHLLSNPVVE